MPLDEVGLENRLADPENVLLDLGTQPEPKPPDVDMGDAENSSKSISIRNVEEGSELAEQVLVSDTSV